MSDTPNDLPPQPSSKPAEDATTTEAPATDGNGAQAAFDAQLAELERQIRDLTDRLLRAHAEMDNIRKRAEREKTDTAKYAISKFARDIVGVADNFQRALAAVPGDTEHNPALQSLLEGVTLTEREFLNALERNGVRRVDPQGEAFNPHLHQAVMEQHNPDVTSGTVLQVFQSGYVIEDRVLRPAMVVVATGGSKAAKPQDASEPQTAGEASGGAGESSGA